MNITPGRQLPGQVTQQENQYSQNPIAKSIATIQSDISQLNQQIRILTGESGLQGKPQSAVLRSDLSKIGNWSMQSSQVSGTVTAAEYNAIWTDVQSLNQILTAIYQALQK